MTRAAAPLPLALTQGDPSGIGPEIAIKAWRATRSEDAPFFVLGDPRHFERVSQVLGLDVRIAETEPQNAPQLFAQALPVVPLHARVIGTPGRPSSADAAATIEAIERAVASVHEGVAAAVVTNPIAKEVLYAAGFPHPGHTEFLGELAARRFGNSRSRPVMMLWSPELAVVPATIHIPLADVPARLTRELLVETGRIVAHDLRERFGIAEPRLVFCGLNPHAGEKGSIGREEIEIIAPALEQLQGEGLRVAGPFPADTLFHAPARARYDAVIAMYHDQALIPIKTIAFESAVNVTLGLPFVRTSPDHGTAFDIAGQGKADPSSLIAALRLAARLTRADPPQ